MSKKDSIQSSRILIIVLVIINMAIILSSFQIFRVQVRSHINNGIRQLESIAELKVNQILEWRKERLSDARYLSFSQEVKQSFKLFNSDTTNTAYRQLLHNSLNGMFLNKHYESMVVMNHHRRIIYSLPEKDSSIQAYFKHEYWQANILSNRIISNNLIVTKDSVPIIQFTIPIKDQAQNDTVTHGWIFLNIDPAKTFFPLLETISIPNAPVDILYLRNDNHKVRIVNRNKQYQNVIEEAGKICATTITKSDHYLEKTKVFPYFGNSMLAVTIPVPEENSCLLIKMDKSVLYADMKRSGMVVLLVTALVIIAFTTTVLLFWQRQRNEIIHLETEKRIIMERLDMLSRFANDAIILYTRDFAIIQVNDKALELYGYSRKEFLSLSADIIRPSNLRPQFHIIHEQAVMEGGFFYETIHIKKDGTEFPVEISLRFVDMMGSHCFQTIIRDISHRKQFEKALVQSEARLKLIMNTMPQIVWTAKPNGMLDFVNSRLASVTGVNPYSRMFLRKIIHPDDFGKIPGFWKNALKKTKEQHIRLRIRLIDKTYRWFLCILSPLCHEDGSIISWYGSATDVNELEIAVAQRTAELSDLYNNAPCGYYTLDQEGNFTNINDTALKWLGYSRTDLLMKSFWDVISPKQQKRAYDEFKTFIKKGNINSLEYEMIRKDGSTFPVLLNATAIRDEQENIIIFRAMIIDHTERKHHEDEILKLNVMLQEHGYNLENTNNELEAFIYSVSHDLRAPLRAINGFTRIILDDHGSELNTEMQFLLQRVWDNANKMRQLIEDLLRLSRTNRQELSFSLIDMHALFMSLVEETRQIFPGRKISVTINPIPKAMGDLALLKQVISNLLSNAVKFSGKKEISEIAIGSLQEAENIVYFIKDNGIGFEMKYAQNLFGVFSRLSNSEDYEGTGVGLALVKRIIERHGGRVWANSEPGNGATFFFTIPKVKTIE